MLGGWYSFTGLKRSGIYILGYSLFFLIQRGVFCFSLGKSNRQFKNDPKR